MNEHEWTTHFKELSKIVSKIVQCLKTKLEILFVKNVWNVIKLKRITQWNQGVTSKLRMFFKQMEENHSKDSYYFRQCWNQCERYESSILNIFMGKLPSFTRVEVYERCLCTLNLMGWRKVWALMRQKVVRDNEKIKHNKRWSKRDYIEI
jgi:sulfur relay (sulfurtransferase) DsrC/TusE family protein